MNIKVSGKTPQEYSNSDYKSDFKTYLESIEDPVIATEGVWDTVKATAAASKAIGGAGLQTVKLGADAVTFATKTTVGGVKVAGKGVKMAFDKGKKLVQQIGPYVDKFLMNFQNNIHNMIAKLLKYEDRYIALGERATKMLALANEISTIKPCAIRCHKVNWEVLAKVMDTIRNTSDVNDPSLVNLVRRKREEGMFLADDTLKALRKALTMEDDADRIQLLSSIRKVIASNPMYDLISVYTSNGGKLDELRNACKLDKTSSLDPGVLSLSILESGSAATAVSFMILGSDVAELDYSEGDVSRFVSFIKHDRGYLRNVAMLFAHSGENMVLVNTLKKGTNGVNRVLNKTKRAMKEGVKAAADLLATEERQAREDRIRSKREQTMSSLSDKGNNSQPKAAKSGLKEDVVDKNQDNNDTASLSSAVSFLLNELQTAHQHTVSSIQGIFQGLLIASYTILEEAESICDLVETMSGLGDDNNG